MRRALRCAVNSQQSTVNSSAARCAAQSTVNSQQSTVAPRSSRLSALPQTVRCGWVQTSPVIAPAARCHPLRLRRGQGFFAFLFVFQKTLCTESLHIKFQLQKIRSSHSFPEGGARVASGNLCRRQKRRPNRQVRQLSRANHRCGKTEA